MRRTHGQSGSITHTSHQRMVERCRDPKSNMYPTYGGAGIAVVDDWVGPGGLERFIAHVGLRPSREYTIDRIDNARGYEPGNVRWATKEQQARNRKSNITATIDGITKCVTEWCQEIGAVSAETAIARVHRGWPPADAVTAPAIHTGRWSAFDRRRVSKHSRVLTVDGRSMTATEWARETGVNDTTLFARIRRGWPDRECVFGRKSA